MIQLWLEEFTQVFQHHVSNNDLLIGECEVHMIFNLIKRDLDSDMMYVNVLKTLNDIQQDLHDASDVHDGLRLLVYIAPDECNLSFIAILLVWDNIYNRFKAVI